MPNPASGRPAWILVTPAGDLPGAWVAHVLDLDLVTQGDSVDDAFDMALDAVRLVVLSDEAKGLDPFARRRAPEEQWELLGQLMRDPRRALLSDLSASERLQVAAAAAQIAIGPSSENVQVRIEPWRMAQLAVNARESCRPS